MNHTTSLQAVIKAALATTLITFAGVCVIADEQIFVQLEQIPGESPDQAHQDWIDAYGLEGLSYLQQSLPGWPVKVTGIVFVKGTDKASVPLMKKIAEGQIIPLAIIEICRPQQGGPPFCHLRIEMETVYVTEFSPAGSACTESTNCVPIQTERIGLSFHRITWIWRDPQGGEKTFLWDATAGGGA